MPLIALFLTMLTWPVGPLVRVKRFCEQEVVPLFDKSYWSELALISLSAGVGEEMLFRGVFQASFTHWWGLRLGPRPGERALRLPASHLVAIHHHRHVPRPLLRRGLDLQRESPDGHRDPHPL